MRATVFSLLFSAVIVLTTSCTKDDSSTNATSFVTNGTWRISLFTDSGNDETHDFSGYSFTFNSDGTLTAANGVTTKTGSWSSGSRKFNINLGVKDNSNRPLGELTDDWKILSAGSSEIRLGDDNTASNEFLTFSKN